MCVIIRKSCLMSLEKNQSPKTNLRMFEFDNKLIWKKTTCNGDHLGAKDDAITSLAEHNALVRNMRR